MSRSWSAEVYGARVTSCRLRSLQERSQPGSSGQSPDACKNRIFCRIARMAMCIVEIRHQSASCLVSSGGTNDAGSTCTPCQSVKLC